MEFAELMDELADAINARDGRRAVACFTEDGVCDDAFHGKFEGAAIGRLVNDLLHRDAEDLYCRYFNVVDDGAIGYAEYEVHYTSTTPGYEGARVRIAGIAMCRLREGRLRHYREFANGAAALAQLGLEETDILRFVSRKTGWKSLTDTES